MNINETCGSCESSLEYPHILCYECESHGNKVTLCVSCFSKGKEFNDHKNDHEYIFVKDVPLFSQDWKFSEELELLEEIYYAGLGNWSEVEENIRNKSASECKEHYFKYYINNPKCTELSTILPYKSHPQKLPFSPMYDTFDPPRPTDFSTLYKDMAGYRAARGDFDVEYLDHIEALLNCVDPGLFNENETLGKKLELAVLDIFRRQLCERELKKRTIQEHGLINSRKVNIFHNQYKSVLPKLSPLIPTLHNLLSQRDMIFLLEGLCYEKQIKDLIKELKEYRINGLQIKEQATLYNTMKKKREITKKKKFKLHLGSDINELQTKELMKINLGNKFLNSLKRASAPLDITGEVEYETLNEEEQQLASTLRILPTRYNKIKSTMIDECQKLNGLLLRQARVLFKLDVNKIKKIYDYLEGNKLIYKPLQSV